MILRWHHRRYRSDSASFFTLQIEGVTGILVAGDETIPMLLAYLRPR